MERETWEALLSFLLAINDALLSPPAVKGNNASCPSSRLMLSKVILPDVTFFPQAVKAAPSHLQLSKGDMNSCPSSLPKLSKVIL